MRFNLGTAQFNKAMYQGAADSYREAIRLKPDVAHAHYNLAMALLRLDEAKVAQAEFLEAHRLDPSLNPLPRTPGNWRFGNRVGPWRRNTRCGQVNFSPSLCPVIRQRAWSQKRLSSELLGISLVALYR